MQNLFKDFSRQIRQAFYQDDLKLTINTVKKSVSTQKKIIEKHSKNQDGIFLGYQLAMMVDRLIRNIWDQLGWKQQAGSRIAIVAVGGYGRQELCPKSDIDLLFLTVKKLSKQEISQIETFIQRLWDFGFEVGSSVRSVRQCWQIRKSDTTSWTALLDCRFLEGNLDLYRKLSTVICRRKFWDYRHFFIQEKLKERQLRIKKYGGWNQYLEPNLKEVSGGLRDVHCIFWIAKQKYDIRNFRDFVDYGVFSPKDSSDLEQAYSFLLKIRWLLHFLTQKKNDILTFDVQKLIAEKMITEKNKNQTKVQTFLGSLSFCIQVVNRITNDFVSRWEKRKKVNHIYFKRQFNQFFQEQKGAIHLLYPDENCFIQNNDLIFEYFNLINETGLVLSGIAFSRLTQAVQYLEVKGINTPHFLRKFLNLSQKGKYVETMLYGMHNVGLIELIIPDFKHIHSHSQYSMYHIYTTDTHTLVLLNTLITLKQNQNPKLKNLVEAYHQIKDLDVLFLACIFHDIGKGVEGDHSVTGAKMIKDYMRAANFRTSQIEEAASLVYYHLEMNEIAQRRNIDDPQTIQDFVGKVKTISTIHKLYVLTYCDTSSVHPDAWSDWKNELLKKLYLQSINYLGKEGEHVLNLQKKRQNVINQVVLDYPLHFVEQHFKSMPEVYLKDVTSSNLYLHLKMLSFFHLKEIEFEIVHRSHFFEIHVLAKDRPRLLLAIVAEFVKMNFSVLEAKIYTRSDGLVLDSFKLQFNAKKQKEFVVMKAVLKKNILENLHVVPLELTQTLIQQNCIDFSTFAQESLELFPLEFSNSISYDFSVVDLSFYDFPGLVYLVIFALNECGVKIHGANLTTEAGLAIDSFYLTTEDYKKVLDSKKIQKIKQLIEDVLMNNNCEILEATNKKH